MEPTKVIVKVFAIYEAKTGKFIRDGLAIYEELQDYANHHYISLPVVDKAGQPWLLEGEPIYFTGQAV